MADPDRMLALRVEKLHSAWEHDVAEVDLHKHRYLSLLAIFLTAALAIIASMLLEKVDSAFGLAFATGMLGCAAYVHLRLRALAKRLRDATAARFLGIDKLIEEEGR